MRLFSKNTLRLLPKKALPWLVLFFVVLVALYYLSDEIGRLMFPIRYMQEIKISSDNFNVDPLLIAAFIRTESNYNPKLKSSKQAIGLMQIMPDTADWIIQSAGYSKQMKDHLQRPDVNIEMGSWYLHWLSQRYQHVFTDERSRTDEIAVIAAAYNAGQTKVSEWLKQEVWDGRYANRDQIPYGETRHYIKRILYYYDKYTQFYAKQF